MAMIDAPLLADHPFVDDGVWGPDMDPKCKVAGCLKSPTFHPAPRWKEETTTTVRLTCVTCGLRSFTPYDGGLYCDGCRRRVTGPARCERSGVPIEDCEDCP